MRPQVLVTDTVFSCLEITKAILAPHDDIVVVALGRPIPLAVLERVDAVMNCARKIEAEMLR